MGGAPGRGLRRALTACSTTRRTPRGRSPLRWVVTAGAMDRPPPPAAARLKRTDALSETVLEFLSGTGRQPPQLRAMMTCFALAAVSHAVVLLLAPELRAPLGMLFLASLVASLALAGLYLRTRPIPHRVRLTPTQVEIDGRTIPLEDIEAIRQEGGCVLLKLQGGTEAVLEEVSPELGRWFIAELEAHVQQRRADLEAAGHDLATPATIPQQLAKLTHRLG